MSITDILTAQISTYNDMLATANKIENPTDRAAYLGKVIESMDKTKRAIEREINK